MLNAFSISPNVESTAPTGTSATIGLFFKQLNLDSSFTPITKLPLLSVTDVSSPESNLKL